MHLPSSLSAATLLQSLTSLAAHRFSSNCPALDSLLTPYTDEAKPEDEPGLPRGAVLELIGPPGIGKSRTGMAFALAEAFKSEGGKVLVVDSEGSLNPTLLYETAAFFAKHNGYDEEQLVACTEKLLHRRVDSTWLLIAFFNTLNHWLEENPEVNLVVIDSLSSHLRPTLDLPTKKLLNDLIRSTLSSVCSSRRVSFVITTKMTIKLFGTDNRPSSWSRDAEAMMVPSVSSNDWLPGADRIGEGVWKVLLYFDQQGERLARLLEAPVPTEASDVPFTMDASGPYDQPVVTSEDELAR
ncbi:uncharacterized protein JCM6883_001825 [Sporobolomyces salmoneus]|uniref:uncharacterized protein n=1 Tax=Sporobolomyces salmoneus TaxID=183962 RepID=UPI00317E4904